MPTGSLMRTQAAFTALVPRSPALLAGGEKNKRGRILDAQPARPRLRGGNRWGGNREEERKAGKTKQVPALLSPSPFARAWELGCGRFMRELVSPGISSLILQTQRVPLLR